MDVRKDIETKVQHLFFTRLHIDISSYPDYHSESLFGTILRCPIREVVLLMLDIEKEFNISVSEEDLLNGSFGTYEKIIKLIEYKVKNAYLNEEVAGLLPDWH